jgi:[acyl-carrier-protein] S-malonyltransferase
MAPAAETLAAALAALELQPMRFPVVFNAAGDFLPEGGSVPEMLTAQVRSPVRFEDGVRALARAGVDTVVEIGPGRVLAGFVKKTAPEITVYGVEPAAELRAVIAALKGA